MSTHLVECLLCGGDLGPVYEGLWDDRFGSTGRYDIVRCRMCGTEQTVPRLEPAAMRALYEQYYNFEMVIATDAQKNIARHKIYGDLREAFINSPLYRFWLAVDGDVSFHTFESSNSPTRQRLLDVGCNEGRGLERHRAYGFEAEGLELNRTAAERARGRGFTVHTVPLAELNTDNPFDIVVLSNVIEHSLDPRSMLKDIWRILKPNGEIWISVPNSRSVFRHLFNRRWINWHVPYHVVHFTPQTLELLLLQEHFTVRSMDFLSPALWIAHSLIAVLFAKPDRPTRQLRSPILVGGMTLAFRLLFFPLLWLANRLGYGDCLRIRAFKISRP